MAKNGKARTILVTGGAGFIGSHLVDRLVAGGAKAVIYDNFDVHYERALKLDNIAPALATGSAILVEGDIRDAKAFRAALASARPDAVVHLAARPGVRPSFEIPEVYLDVNVGGTLNVLRACEEAGVPRVVFASSSSVYGSVDEPADEERTPCRPLSPYGASKVAAEALCSSFARNRMSVIALRFFTVFGPRQRPDMAINRFTRMITEGEPIPVYGDGSSLRDYTYVSDVITGIVAAIERELPGYHVYNLGRGQPVVLNDLLGLIEAALEKRAERSYIEPQRGDPQSTCADISRAQRELGYEPSVSTKEGVKFYTEWFREQRRERVGSR